MEERLTRPIWQLAETRMTLWRNVQQVCRSIIVGDQWISIDNFNWQYALLECILNHVPLWRATYIVKEKRKREYDICYDETLTLFFPSYRVQTQFVEWLDPIRVVHDRYTMTNKIVAYLLTKKQISRDVALYVCTFLEFVN